ncbi:MAG: hypothetical protein AAGD11_09205 [Planctomycetota bacterium]
MVLALFIQSVALLSNASSAEKIEPQDLPGTVRVDGNEPKVHGQVHVDITRGLKIGGSERLRREAYFNVHSTPGEFSADETDWLVGELQANFGRSMGTVSSYIHGLVEDPSRPGFADPKFAAERAKTFASRRRLDQGVDHVRLVNSVHPYSYYGKPDEDPESATFIPGSHEAAAELLSIFFQATSIDTEPYFEVANEGNVKVSGLGTTFADLCDLHATVARRLHQDVPGLKVGGPTAAWPAFEVNNFRVWREQMGMFIDRVGDEMDFLSVHLYSTHWDDKLVTRFGANIDAILDLMENHCVIQHGAVKPLLISECGTGLRTGEQIAEEYSAKRDWLILRGANHVLMNLIKRDNRILKMIPFIVSKATWFRADHPYPWVLFHRNGSEWTPTHLAKWLEFWKNVDGRHLPTSCSMLDVQTHAVLDDSSVFLVLDNLTDSDVRLDVNASTDRDVDINSASLVRLYWDGLEPRLERRSLAREQWKWHELAPHETRIVRLELSSTPAMESTIVESTYYGNKTVEEVGSRPSYFQIKRPSLAIAPISAMLRVGFGRSKTLSKQLTAEINGHQLEVPLDERGECDLQGDQIFTTKEIQVPVRFLKKSNRIAVHFPEAGGHVSSVVLVVREEQELLGGGVAEARPYDRTRE